MNRGWARRLAITQSQELEKAQNNLPDVGFY